MRRGATSALALVGAAALLLSGAGCPERPDPARVREVWEQSRIDAARFEALILNRGAYAADLSGKYRRIWAGLQLDRQVPREPDPERLTDALEAHAADLGLEVKLERKPLPLSGSLPATVGPDEAIPWSNETIFRRFRLTLSFTPADLGKLEAWFRKRERLGRLLEIESVKLTGQRARVVATAYAFRTDLALPRRRVAPFDFAAILEEAGLSPSSVAKSPKLEEARARYAELEARRPQIDEALQLRTEIELMDERYERLVEIRQRCARQRWLEVLK